MASTTGYVQKLNWAGSIASLCAYIGPTSDSTEIFLIQIKSADAPDVRGFKRSMIHALTKAQSAGYPVTVSHPDNSAEITQVTFGQFNISPIGMAIHNDFYAISGTNIPDDVEIIFETNSLVVTVTPDLVRPHWVFLAEFPASISTGRVMVRLEAPGWSSDAVPIDVSNGPRNRVRMLYSGAPKTSPYTIAFVANPAIESEAGGTFTTDPVLTDRPGFHDTVSVCLENMLTVTEDLLRQGNMDAHIRFVAIFDETLTPSDANSLAHALSPNLMETRRTKLKSFLNRYSEEADMVFVIHGSTTYDRATAWFTTDDAGEASTTFTYDGTNHVHGHYAEIPGSAAIPTSLNITGLTPIHEFGHAASDFDNGRVRDLYNDGSGGFMINKKMRTNAQDPVPANFGTYNGTNYQSDQNRDGLGYPNTWRSYHPELIDNTRPNLMDNYWLTFDDPQLCRLDQLTYDWFSERLRAKIFR